MAMTISLMLHSDTQKYNVGLHALHKSNDRTFLETIFADFTVVLNT